MKYQAAHTIGTTYRFWVEIGAPVEKELRAIARDGSAYLDWQKSKFYRTNLVNPVGADPPLVFVKQDETELEAEFADEVPVDDHWWK